MANKANRNRNKNTHVSIDFCRDKRNYNNNKIQYPFIHTSTVLTQAGYHFANFSKDKK